MPALDRLGDPAVYRDDAGDRTRTDAFLLARLGLTDGPLPEARGPDEALWGLAVSGSGDPSTHVRPRERLFEADAWSAIEVATEAELSGLQALSHLATRSPKLWARCLDAARWNLAELQADNATNRPWGIGVFFGLWCWEANAGALHYAEGQLHAAQIGSGIAAGPDTRSALILEDAAQWLERFVPPQAG